MNDHLELPESATNLATKHVGDILDLAFEHTPDHRAVVVFDMECALARTLTAAYRSCLTSASFVEFDRDDPERVLQAFEPLESGDLVVLVQSTSFRLAAFRIRLELFRRGLKVLEHPHLARMLGEEPLTYIDSLAYDPTYYRVVGAELKVRIDRAETAFIESGGETLAFSAGLEPAKLNVGDYRTMKNVGGQYPIGEVFTESRDLEAVNGRIRIACFGDTRYRVNKPEEPITLVIEKGRIVDTLGTTPEFEAVLENIRADEGEVLVRELGFGMNRAFSPTRVVSDIGTYERMCGIHLSIGAKHASYNKPGIRKRSARHHVDVFAVTTSVRLDDEVVFKDDAWIVTPGSGHS